MNMINFFCCDGSANQNECQISNYDDGGSEIKSIGIKFKNKIEYFSNW